MADVLNNFFASAFTVKDIYGTREITPAQPNIFFFFYIINRLRQ